MCVSAPNAILRASAQNRFYGLVRKMRFCALVRKLRFCAFTHFPPLFCGDKRNILFATLLKNSISPWAVAWCTITAYFSTFGDIKAIRLPKKMVGTGPHRGFAFVEFYTKEDAKVRTFLFNLLL